MDKDSILQRTELGREAILSKAVKLTQSERLVLIIVDGISPVEELRKKVWTINEARFQRALRVLIDKELVCEIMMPVPGQKKEILDQKVMDHFLQQDPLDPVTIIAFDPEDEFGSDMAETLGFTRASAGMPVPEPNWAVAPMSSAVAMAAGTETLEARALAPCILDAAASVKSPPFSTNLPLEKDGKHLLAPSDLDAFHRRAAVRPMPGKQHLAEATAKANIQKREHMSSVAAAPPSARTVPMARAQAALVSDRSPNINWDWDDFPSQREEASIWKKALLRRSISCAGTIVIWLGLSAGILGLAFIVTRTLLQRG